MQFINYYNDHKYRLIQLIQNLKNRNFQAFASVIAEYETISLLIHLIKIEDLKHEIATLSSLHILLETNQNESYTCVLKHKACKIASKYEDIQNRIESENDSFSKAIEPTLEEL